MPTRREFLEKVAASAAYTAISNQLVTAQVPRVDPLAPKPEIQMFVTDSTRHHGEA